MSFVALSFLLMLVLGMSELVFSTQDASQFIETQHGEFTIRKYKDEDNSAVKQLYVSGVAWNFKQLGRPVSKVMDKSIPISVEKDFPRMAEVYDLGEDFNKPRIGGFWVATNRTGSVVASIGVSRSVTNASVAVLRRLSVAPSAQRRGLAAKLVHHVEQWCQVHGFDKIVLDTNREFSGARVLYKRCCYEMYNVVCQQVVVEGSEEKIKITHEGPNVDYENVPRHDEHNCDLYFQKVLSQGGYCAVGKHHNWPQMR